MRLWSPPISLNPFDKGGKKKTVRISKQWHTHTDETVNNKSKMFQKYDRT